MLIRNASLQDLELVSDVEKECFPAAEAAPREQFEQRLTYYPECFWLLFEEEKLISFIDGFATDDPDLNDEMYADASLHRKDGAWQMIFGVNTIPSMQRKGYASALMRHVIEDSRTRGRKGLVLTCKKEKIHWYASFGFVNEGVSSSEHGGVLWYQMRLAF